MDLIYKGSKDGFGSRDFHQACDLLAPLLIVIKADTGKIFGGYTDVPFCGNEEGKYIASSESFVFSLDNKEMYPVKKDH